MSSTSARIAAGPWRLAALALAVLLVVFAVARLWSYSLRQVGVDFYHFWGVPVAHAAGVDNVYVPSGREALGEILRHHAAAPGEVRLAAASGYWAETKPTATPFFYALFGAWRGDDYEADYRQFQAVSSVLAAVALLLLGQLLRIPLPGVLIAIALCGLALTPVRADVMVANVNRLMLLPVVAYGALRLAAYRRAHAGWSLASGAVLALSILFKPIFLAAVATLGLNRLVLRQYRPLALEALGAIAAAGLACVVTLAVYGGLRIWLDWAENVPQMLASYIEQTIIDFKHGGIGNLAPRLWLHALIGAPALVVCTLIAVAMLAAQFVALRRLRSAGPGPLAQVDFTALGLALALYVWMSELVWAHYYTVAIPWLLVSVAAARRRYGWALASCAALTVAALEFGSAAAATAAIIPFTAALLLLLRRDSIPGLDRKTSDREPGPVFVASGRS